MIYSEFKDKKLSLLGFGTMRLPLIPDSGEVDEEQVAKMVRCAADHGVNYYDTAYPYHNSRSEIIIGKALKQLPRDSFYLATKYPGHQIAESYDPAAIFEEQQKNAMLSTLIFICFTMFTKIRSACTPIRFGRSSTILLSRKNKVV